MKKLIGAALIVCLMGMICGTTAQAGDMEKKIKARQAVEQTYLDCLGRKASDEEVNHYIKLLEEGKSGESVRKGIILSEECKNAINKIFKEVKGHEASEENLNKAREALAEGKSLEQVKQKLLKK
ncbi:MAG: hypothetical protein AB7T27_00380 [Kiritimatiellia bacterium]